MRYTFLLFFISFIIASDANKDLVIEIEQSIMAPCCWSGTVYDHGNKELEDEISSMVHEGKNKQEILDHYVKIYGERILAIPIAQGFNIMAWGAPVIIAIAALMVLGLYLRRPVKNEQKSSLATPESSIPFDEEIEKELKKLD